MKTHHFHCSFRTSSVLFSILCFFLFFTSNLAAQSTSRRSIVWKGHPAEVRGYDILVEYANGSESIARDYAIYKDAEIVKHIEKARTYVFRLPEGRDLETAVQEALKQDGIVAASPVFFGIPLTTPTDYFYTSGQQWALKNYGQTPPGGTAGADIHIEAAWAFTTGSPDIRVAILDSGIPTEWSSPSHRDLSGSRFDLRETVFHHGVYDIFNDGYGHGSMVTGIVAATWGLPGGSTGHMAGVVHYSKILICKLMDDATGSVDLVDAISMIISASENDSADVILCAFGFDPFWGEPPGLRNAVQEAVIEDAIIVAGSGPDGSSYLYYPAKFAPTESNVLSVGGTDMNDERGAYSNYSTELSVVAPGGGTGSETEKILTCVPEHHNFTLFDGDSIYDYAAGTSMAAAHAAGVAALIRARFPNATATQVRNTLRTSADDLGPSGYDPWYGFGRINAFNAVAMPVRNVQLTETSGTHHPRLTWTAPAHSLPISTYRIKRVMQTLSGQITHYFFTTSTSWTDYDIIVGGELRIDYYVQAKDAVDYQYGAWDGPHRTYYDGGIASPPSDNNLEIYILPEEFAMTSVYPNPFNSSTTITYDLPETAPVSVQIYNSVGRIVATLASGEIPAGHHTLVWTAENVPSGVYFVRCAALGEAFVRKIAYVK
ncbi:MAG: S8/S53 family peptidase [bacterium]